MRDLLSIGTSRGCEMIGTGIGLGLSGFNLARLPFSPSSISGLQLWLDASDSTTLSQSSGGSPASSDGDPIGYWADKSGNGRHAVQTDGTKKPALKLAIQNGKNVARWDGTNDFLTIAGSSSTMKFLHSTNSTVFAVFSSSVNNKCLLSTDNNSTNVVGYGIYLDTTGGNITHVISKGSAPLVIAYQANIGSITAKCLLTVVSKPSNATAADRSSISKNSGTPVTANTYTGTPTTSNSYGDFNVGARAFSNDVNLNGDICELVIFNSALDSNDKSRIENYLNAKWSIF
jgi:hypothetical protein